MKSSVLILSVLSFVFAHAQDGGEKVAFCTFDTDEGDVQGKTYLAKDHWSDFRDPWFSYWGLDSQYQLRLDRE